MDEHVWVLMTGDYVDPSTILSAHRSAERGRAAFTPAAVKMLIEDRHATLTEYPDGVLDIQGSNQFLSLAPFPLDPAPDTAPATVAYEGEQHEVVWLGVRNGHALLQIRPLAGAGAVQTVRVSDLDTDY